MKFLTFIIISSNEKKYKTIMLKNNENNNENDNKNNNEKNNEKNNENNNEKIIKIIIKNKKRSLFF